MQMTRPASMPTITRNHGVLDAVVTVSPSFNEPAGSAFKVTGYGFVALTAANDFLGPRHTTKSTIAMLVFRIDTTVELL